MCNINVPAGKIAHRLQRGQIQRPIEDVRIAGVGGNLTGCPLAALRIATGHVDACAASRQIASRLLADAHIAAGDDHHLAGHRDIRLVELAALKVGAGTSIQVLGLYSCFGGCALGLQYVR